MLKGKLYTVIGVDGFSITRKDGLSVKLDKTSVDCSIKNIEEEIAEGVILMDTQAFMDNGYSAVVECELVKGQVIATDLLAEGEADEFSEFLARDYDDEDEYEDDYE